MARATSIFYTAKSVRRQPTFSPLDKSRRTFLGAFLTTVVLTSACAVFYIGTHVQAVNLGYKISLELQKKERLIEENKRLDLEIARLKSPTRIEEVAKASFGLVLPKAQQVFYVSRWDEGLDVLLAGAPEKVLPPKNVDKSPPTTVAAKTEKPKAESPVKTAAKSLKVSPAPKSAKPAAAPKKPAEKAPAKVAAATKPAPVAKAEAPKPKAASGAKVSKSAALKPAKQDSPKTAAPAPSEKKKEVLMARIIDKASVTEKSPQPKAGPALAYQPKERVPAVMLDPLP